MKQIAITLRAICLLAYVTPGISQVTASLTLNSNTQGTKTARDEIKMTTAGGPGGHLISNNPALDGHLYLNRAAQISATYQSAQPTVNTLRPLDQTLKPGVIAGGHSVDLSGGFNYTIPIQLPPGTNNMMPSLGLSYSSGSGEGTMGMGWGIAGLSVISRASKDLFHDGVNGGIEFNVSGPFSLDGNRLVFQGANGNGENYYFTESETFSQVTLKNQNSQGQQYFEVRTKSGLIMLYGSTADSKATIPFAGRTMPAAGGVVQWYLSKVIDNYGNYMEYTYYNSGSSSEGSNIAIKEINYTGNSNASITPYNSVKFYYDLKANTQRYYVKGDYIDQKLILREISVYADGSPLMPCFNYKLNYSKGAFDYLDEVVFSANGESINSTAFLYGDPAPAPTKLYSTNNLPLDADYSSLDLNGDGLSDLIAFMYNPGTIDATFGTKSYYEFRVYLNSGSVGTTQLFTLQQTVTENFSFSNFVNTFLGLSPVKDGLLLADVTGDELPEIIYSHPTGSSFHEIYVKEYNRVANQFQNLNYSQQPFQVRNTTVPNGESISLALGDYDGDGKVELISYWTDAAANYEFKYLDFNDNTSITRTDSDISQQQVFDTQNQSHHLDIYKSFSAFDFDGDGKSDLAGHVIAGGFNAFIKVDVGAGSLSMNEIYRTTNSLSHSIGGDYNGDGYMDFATEFASHFDLFYGTGAGIATNFQIGSQRAIDVKRLALDANNDGKSDILELYSDQNAGHIQIDLWNGARPDAGFTNNIGFIPGFKTPWNKDDEIDANELGPGRDYGTGIGDSYSTNEHEIPAYEIGDFNGDGNADLLLKLMPIGGGPSEMRIICLNELSDERYLTRVYDGHNNQLKVDYFRLANQSRITANTTPGCTGAGYASATSAPTFPLTNVTTARNVVGYVSDLTDGPNEGFREAYYYTNAVSHLQGRGFLGFDKVVKKSRRYGTSADVFQSTQEFGLDATYLVRTPLQSKEEFLSPSGNTVFSSTTFNASVYGYGTGASTRYFSEVSSVTTLDHYSNVSTTKSFTYDHNNGNLLQQITNVGPNRESTQVDFSNFINAGSWIQNMPQAETITVTKAGESPFTRNKAYSYDVVFGSLLVSSEEPTATQEVLTSSVYDANTGVLKQVVSSAPNESPAPPPVTINYDYDARHRFVEKSSTPAPYYASETKRDAVYGNILSSTSADGLVTKYRYDNFGSLQEVLSPDGTKTTYSQDWFNAGALDPSDPKPVNGSLAKFMSRADHPGGKWELAVTDRFGRTLKTMSNTFNNAKFSNLAVYNSNGELEEEYGPYLIPLPMGKVALKSTNSYLPDLGALSSRQLSDGTTNLTSSVQYNFNPGAKELSITSTGPDGKSTTSVKDATGRLVRVVDNNSGVLSYEYHYNGSEFINITKFNGTTVLTKKTDNFNHLTEETEPNSGTKVYTSNAFGQLTSMTDNKGTQTLYTYDIAGRLIMKSLGPDYYNYIYRDAGPGKGQIEEINLNNGNAYKYTYDDFGRPKQVEEFFDGKSYLSGYEYDQLGRVSREMYPNNFIRVNEYANGDLVKILNGLDHTMLWQLDELDNSGAISKYTLGNNIQSFCDYDDFGTLRQLQSGLVQDQIYNFNTANGNLNSVTDVMNATQENYVYDNLDRLKTINNASYGGNIGITYDAKGNITSKYDAGAYTYHGTRHNQVIVASNPVTPDPQISTQVQDVNYNLFDKATFLQEGNYSADIFYCPQQQRYKTVFKYNNTATGSRYYLNGLERTEGGGVITDINYIEAPTGLCAMLVAEPNLPTAMHYVYNDHLGSIVAITDENGAVEARQSFDAWGRQRDPVTHDHASITGGPGWLSRGFTGHEHLPNFTLINMNGRMYDPVLSRMLSADPVLADPGNAQDYNKYSYARNNPLKYTDPSGNVVWAAAATIWISAGIFSGIASQIGVSAVYANQNPYSPRPFTPGNKQAVAQAQYYDATYSSRIPMSGVNTGPGKNDVGDWTENILYTYGMRNVWIDPERIPARLRSLFGDTDSEKIGTKGSDWDIIIPGHWEERYQISTYYVPEGGKVEGVWFDNINEGLNYAWNNSNKEQWEYGGFVFNNGIYIVKGIEAKKWRSITEFDIIKGNYGELDIKINGSYKSILGEFHTHPYDPKKFPGMEWFNTDDQTQSYAFYNGVPGFIIGSNNEYFIGGRTRSGKFIKGHDLSGSKYLYTRDQVLNKKFPWVKYLESYRKYLSGN